MDISDIITLISTVVPSILTAITILASNSSQKRQSKEETRRQILQHENALKLEMLRAEEERKRIALEKTIDTDRQRTSKAYVLYGNLISSCFANYPGLQIQKNVYCCTGDACILSS